jgi:hypothetical protein
MSRRISGEFSPILLEKTTMSGSPSVAANYHAGLSDAMAARTCQRV